MLHGLLNAQWITLHGLVALLGVAFFVVASRLRGQRRHPSAAMAWVISLALMPYVALPLYLLIGNRKVRRHRAAASSWQADTGHADTHAERFGRLTLAMGLPRPALYEQLAIHDNGAVAWQALQDTMRGARRTLDVSSFLLGRDALGDAVIAIMVERATAGVQVRFLIDGIGRYLGGRPDLRRLSDAGVTVAVFVSPFRSALPGRT
ncbi:MAG: PLDc N-terminal domain-containing protein, partial [Burkholderiaceae bacterium]